MVYFRRLIWFIARKLILWSVLLGMLVCGFYMAMNIANIRVVLEDGLEKRVDVLLTRQKAEDLNKYFHADFLRQDPALDDAVNKHNSFYENYNITGFEYELTIEKLWAWPWDTYATCTVVEKVPSIQGSVVASKRSEVPSRIPPYDGGRYDITLEKVGGEWKIMGMQQRSVLLQATDTEEALQSEVLMP